MTRITEALGSAERTGPGRVKLTIITPGQGSSGFYSAEVLQQAVADKVFPRGTHSFVNHTTAVEDAERPEGDLRNLAGVLLEDARWDGEKVVAEARIGSAWRSFVEEFGEFIGVSISAAAEIADDGTVVRLHPHPFTRVDLVTKAGRGGEISEVLEAARVIESRSIVNETTADNIRNWLSVAVRDQHAKNGDWAYMVDHDETNVYYEHDGGKLWQQGYTLTGSTITLDGDPVEVRKRTEYDPVTPTDPPADPAEATPTHTQEGATMAHIDDNELTQLRESASRADQLAAENQALKDAADKAALEARQGQARNAVREAFGKDATAFYLAAADRAAESEDYDHAAFTEQVTEAAAKAAQGAGTPNLGGATTGTVTERKTPTADDNIAALEGRI